MNLCGRRRCWVVDRGLPGGRMNLCVSYGRDYNRRKGKGRYTTISGIV